MKRHILTASVLVSALSFFSLSCSLVKDYGNALLNLQRCKFRLSGVSDFNLAGIPLSAKTSISVEDGLKLLPAFQQQRFPASFNLNVAAINSNDSTGGTPKSTATLTSFAWTLLIDSTVTIGGNIANPITIPGTGQQVIIPLHMDLDLFSSLRIADTRISSILRSRSEEQIRTPAGSSSGQSPRSGRSTAT
jgi:hypothetical protein